MYWAKQPVLRWLKDLDLGADDFEAELGQLDGTTAHAVERLVGFASREVGGTHIATTDRLDR
jgi:lipopolysaccharide biosynthesis protein